MTFITPSKVFAHLDRLDGWRRGGKPAPVTLEWDLSNRCSLGCFACHFAHTHTKGPWVTQDRRLPMAYDSGGDLADTALVLRALPEVARAGVRGIVWTGGGEPTLHPDWPLIVERAHALGLEQGMYTLGGHLTPETAAVIARGLTWVVVSLDACDAATYAAEKGVGPERFEAACAGIRHLRAAGAFVGVSYLVHRQNWTALRSMLRLARDLGASYTTFRPTIDTHPDRPAEATEDRRWITAALSSLAALAAEPDVECDVARFVAYRDWAGRSYAICHGIKLNATITPDGRVWVCPQRRGIAGSEIGDLRTESFQNLWQRHPGQWTEFQDCRVMCRLHLVNEALAPVFQPYAHEAFV